MKTQDKQRYLKSEEKVEKKDEKNGVRILAQIKRCKENDEINMENLWHESWPDGWRDSHGR